MVQEFQKLNQNAKVVENFLLKTEVSATTTITTIIILLGMI